MSSIGSETAGVMLGRAHMLLSREHGRLQAYAELQEYLGTDTAASDALRDRELVTQLLEYSSNVVSGDGECLPLTVSSQLGKPPPKVRTGRKVPLTW